MIDLLAILAVYAVPAVLAITLHEAAHGYVARALGDSTAWLLGRVSLNPLRHVDPLGTVILPGLLLLGGLLTGTQPLLFGWARPVPVNFGRLRRPRRDSLLVALAGPGMNLAQMLAWTLALAALAQLGGDSGPPDLLVNICLAGMSVNLALAAFNLLPILPLDGGRVVAALLPWRWALSYARLERWGLPLVLVLFCCGLLAPLFGLLYRLVEWAVVA